MNVLVTGGAGFIGSHIVDALLARGDPVSVVDNLVTGRREHLNPKATFYDLDIRNPALIDLIAAERFDAVIHHAAQVNVMTSLRDPGLDAEINIIGSVNLIQGCLRGGVGKLVYASSGSAGCGEPLYLPVDERHPAVPLSPYGVSKHTVEHYLYLYGASQGLRWTTLRYANVYGPWQDPYGEGGVVAIFTRKMLDGVCPTIYGDGEQTRDFVYVTDVVETNLLALERGEGHALNVGSGVETTVNEIFARLKVLTGFAGEPIYAEARPGEVRRTCLAVGGAAAALGWRPKVSLAEGLALTVKHFASKGIK